MKPALPEVLHHACIVVALKGTGKAAVLDYGVIHMLVHCLPGSKSAEMTDEYLGLTRRTYGRECRLSP